ncbi:MAG: hypothetical protein BRD50_05475 [Bacteroidetes bacterium SW_11_45_7]|nr:MAG: hypothetical protein BRD50_05475 [Bacteroidetes bacterium SW_11_45_7]
MVTVLFVIGFQSAIGQIKFQQFYDYSNTDRGYGVTQTSDGSHLVSGEMNVIGNQDMALLKMNKNGALQWSKVYGSSGGEEARDVIETADSNYLIAGQADADITLIKTQPNGDTLWTQSYGGQYTDVVYDIEQTDDDGFIGVGYTDNFDAAASVENIFMFKTDVNGQLCRSWWL